MTQNKNLGAIKTQLLKIAQEIGEPTASPAMGAPAPGSPEEVMELIENAIEVLEVAEETIPAESPAEAVPPTIGAKAKKGMQDEELTSDEEDETKSEDKKGAKAKGAQDEDEEDDDEKKQMEARIASLESELNERTKQALAEEYSEIFNEDVREAKYDEIVNSKDEIAVLEAKVKVAKETAEQFTPSKQYKPAKNESGYLSQFRKASLDNTNKPEWRY